MRRIGRELALQILFQSEFAPLISSADLQEIMTEPMAKEAVEFAQELIQGVQKNQVEIDSKIRSVSQHWKLERMAGVDRNILRLAVYEMNFAPEALKPAIAINEAVELAKKFGSTDSASFVNGVLDQIGKGL